MSKPHRTVAAPTLAAVWPAQAFPAAPPPVGSAPPPSDPREELARYCNRPWPLPEDDIDLPFGPPPPPDEAAPPASDPAAPVVIGTVRAAFSDDARYGHAPCWHDIEVRIDPPLSVEIGGYLLTRKEIAKLQLRLALALELLRKEAAG